MNVCMKKGKSKPLSPEMAAELSALAARTEVTIDTQDIPEVTDWSGAVRGKFYRPDHPNPTAAREPKHRNKRAPLASRR
jgi:hypothetical protein